VPARTAPPALTRRYRFQRPGTRRYPLRHGWASADPITHSHVDFDESLGADLADADPAAPAGLFASTAKLYWAFTWPERISGVAVAKVHKIVHLKRPGLYPILDEHIKRLYRRAAHSRHGDLHRRRTVTVPAGASEEFSAWLPPGRYQVTVRSPDIETVTSSGPDLEQACSQPCR